MLLAVGGLSISTEIFEVGVSSQGTEVSPLSKGLMDLRASTVNNRIYLTSEDMDNGH